ncbi:phosphotransferase [Cellulomonas sp. URHD0024]|uniref:phosphotransferase n=1 Tax=Cellulomonas sp. URHD0024 TaxID=1302620 RepID=UPI0004016427|nr:aminoglycoside phosphotransferase family protein [Cellulomonas sp. URHD0024]
MNSAGLAPNDPVHESPGPSDSTPGVPTARRASQPLPPVDPALAADPGPLLASGETVDVFALDEHTVLRRYRSGRDATHEVDLLRHAVAHGFPAPAVLAASGPDLVMERVHGPTLLQALGAEEISLSDAAGILADLHARLHAIPAPPGWTSSEPEAWPLFPAGPVIVHLDIHPANVILSEHGPVLVDWSNSRTGTPELDVALTALIVAEVAVDAGGIYSQAARSLLVAFLHAIHVDPLGALDAAAALRSADPALVPGEQELVPAAARLVRDLIEVATPPA